MTNEENKVLPDDRDQMSIRLLELFEDRRQLQER